MSKYWQSRATKVPLKTLTCFVLMTFSLFRPSLRTLTDGPPFTESFLLVNGGAAQVLQAFQSDPEVQVLLISLKAGGVALNLTVANHIFLMDP